MAPAVLYRSIADDGPFLDMIAAGVRSERIGAAALWHLFRLLAAIVDLLLLDEDRMV
jgi:hypothetical protein